MKRWKAPVAWEAVKPPGGYERALLDAVLRSWQDGDVDRDTYADHQHTLIAWSDHQQ